MVQEVKGGTEASGDDNKNQTCFIEKFKFIGFIDPYPDKENGGGATTAANKEKSKPSMDSLKFQKDLYPECKMNNPDKPPTMIYIPTADIMVKMIKASIGVKSVYDILDKF